MNRLVTFLRSLIWTSVFSVVALALSNLLALTNFPEGLPLTLAASAIALAILSKD